MLAKEEHPHRVQTMLVRQHGLIGWHVHTDLPEAILEYMYCRYIRSRDFRKEESPTPETGNTDRPKTVALALAVSERSARIRKI